MSKNIFKSIVILGLSFVLAIMLVKPIGVSTEYSTTAVELLRKHSIPLLFQRKKTVKSKLPTSTIKITPKLQTILNILFLIACYLSYLFLLEHF